MMNFGQVDCGFFFNVLICKMYCKYNMSRSTFIAPVIQYIPLQSINSIVVSSLMYPGGIGDTGSSTSAPQHLVAAGPQSVVLPHRDILMVALHISHPSACILPPWKVGSIWTPFYAERPMSFRLTIVHLSLSS